MKAPRQRYKITVEFTELPEGDSIVKRLRRVINSLPQFGARCIDHHAEQPPTQRTWLDAQNVRREASFKEHRKAQRT